MSGRQYSIGPEGSQETGRAGRRATPRHAASGYAGFAYAALLVGVPVGALALAAIGAGPRAIVAEFGRAEVRAALGLTLGVATLVAAVNGILGTITAFALARGSFPGRRLLDALVELPGMVPPFVAGVAMFVVFGSGLFGGARFSWPADAPRALPPLALVAPLLFVTYPIVVRCVESALRGAEVERGDGGRGGDARGDPSVLGALVSGALTVLARAAGEFGAIILFVDWKEGAARPASVALADAVNADRAGATAIAIALLALAAVLAVAARVVSRGAPGAVAAGPRGMATSAAGANRVSTPAESTAAATDDRPPRRSPRNALLAIVAALHFGALIAAPLGLLVRCFATADLGREFAGDALPRVIGPILITLFVAALATAANVAFGAAIAQVLARDSLPGRRLLDALVTLGGFLAPIAAGYAILLAAAPDSRVGAGADTSLVAPWFAFAAAAAFASLPIVVRALAQPVPEGTRARTRWRLARAAALSLASACGALGALVGVTGAAPRGPRTATYAALEAVHPGARALVLLLLALSIGFFAIAQFARWRASRVGRARPAR